MINKVVKIHEEGNPLGLPQSCVSVFAGLLALMKNFRLKDVISAKIHCRTGGNCFIDKLRMTLMMYFLALMKFLSFREGF